MNPGEAYAPAGFQDRCIQPLCHPSLYKRLAHDTVTELEGKEFYNDTFGEWFRCPNFSGLDLLLLLGFIDH